MLCRLHLAGPHRPLESRALWPRTQSLFEELEHEMESVWDFLSGWQPWAPRAVQEEETVARRTEAAGVAASPKAACPFAVAQDMTGFDPKELVVKLVGGKVVLTGKKATETPNGPFRYELFRREWEVPESVDRDRLTCSISSEGHLRIEAPLAEPAARNVPIEINRAAENAAEAEQETPSTEDSRTKG